MLIPTKQTVHCKREARVFLTNRSVDEKAEVCVSLADATIASCESAELLSGPDAKAANTFEDCAVVKAATFESLDVREGQAQCQLPALSFAAMTFTLR